MSNEVPPLKESRLQQRLNPTCIEQIQLHESFRDITNLRAKSPQNVGNLFPLLHFIKATDW